MLRRSSDKVELRAVREESSMAWILTPQLARVVADELRAAGWSVSVDEARTASDSGSG